eukprot:COSAG02_NODE_2388_length_8979_cov_6.381081_5_plen_298_part_00
MPSTTVAGACDHRSVLAERRRRRLQQTLQWLTPGGGASSPPRRCATAVGPIGASITPASSARHVLIAGATGVVGRAAVEHFTALGNWKVTLVSRRPPAYDTSATHIQLDLTDESACSAVLEKMKGITHLIYTAIAGVNISDPGEISTNTSMLRNTLLPLEAGSRDTLRHVSILQGRKAYAEYDPTQMLWPLKEKQPRHGGKAPVENQSSWYFTQEDFLKAQRALPGVRWTYTIWRPPTVLGFVPGAPLNMIAALGVYAAVSRELGEPLRYPGGPPIVKQLCDSRVLARALSWCLSWQ